MKNSNEFVSFFAVLLFTYALQALDEVTGTLTVSDQSEFTDDYKYATKRVVNVSAIEEIPSEAIYQMTSLISAEISGTVTSIGISAFSSCSGLKTVTIGESMEIIGNFPF